MVHCLVMVFWALLFSTSAGSPPIGEAVTSEQFLTVSSDASELAGSADGSNTVSVNQDRFVAAKGSSEAQKNSEHSFTGRNFVTERIVPRWFGEGERFWYRIKLQDGSFEFVIVDPEGGTREVAFDASIVKIYLESKPEYRADTIERLALDADSGDLLLISRRFVFVWDRSSATVRIDSRIPRDFPTSFSVEGVRQQTGQETYIRIENQTKSRVELIWNAGDRSRKSYGFIGPGEIKEQHTFGGHRWLVVDETGAVIRRLVANDFGLDMVLSSDEKGIDVPTKEENLSPARSNRGFGSRNRGGDSRLENSEISPDGKWRYEHRDGDLWCIGLQGQTAVKLEAASSGGEYLPVTWLKNSNHLVAFKKKLVTKLPIHIVRSSPSEGGRAVLESIPYALPGDPFPTYELRIYNPETTGVNVPEIDLFEHEWEQPQITVLDDGESFCYELVDRGHQRHRLIKVNGLTGKMQPLVDEQSDTFIWTAHTEAHAPPRISWLSSKREFIHSTERNGWRQLFLVDALTGGPLRELTPIGIVVRSIERIDERSRTLWFSACGLQSKNPDALEDPYHIHYGRVSLDTGEITWLTAGNGTHSLIYSPSGNFIIDTYSRVDMPPVTELRVAETGELVVEIESTNLEAWREAGGTTDEIFTAKGRDGVTDIWGIICRPTNFEPGKKYPVVEDIYAGPHGSFVPKNFSAARRYRELTDLGFIVVKIDGMGTANRSKAFQDVCWKNLKDGGFEDRILWMKAAAEKYLELDLDRVGIFGVSAGGQNAAAALLHHGDLYKVAVAGCGCHDNRMDKASWNEQWMGYPVGKHYADSSNIDNAHLLKGKLLLIVGEVDTNVPPESTLRFADALIRHDKDFELLVVPNEGHGIGGPYGEKRKIQFLLNHLMHRSASD